MKKFLALSSLLFLVACKGQVVPPATEEVPTEEQPTAEEPATGETAVEAAAE